MLTTEQVDYYHEHGYVKAEGLFTEAESEELALEMTRVIEEWGEETIGWRGPWRDRYLAEDERLNTKAVFMHNPHFYSSAWGRVIFHSGLTDSVRALIGDAVQWHHAVLHAKPPELGTPFPMHQDYPFYPHDGPNFVDCLLHLDDTPKESGCLRVVPGSHKLGPLVHNLGPETSPHLPPETYHPDKVESSEVPAEEGDVIFFSYQTIHWSDCNRTDAWRKSVRFGYHCTRMRPIGRAEDDPWRIDGENILDRKDSIIVTGFRSNEGDEQSAYTVPTSAGKKEGQ
ncbi:TPA: phytanoyl-CoA dioxygenase [Candidatus Latescibacteria bacterium]|nr:phytanoyl-CoA dioxygenase [Candidatus Latescibacterota bacterium]